MGSGSWAVSHTGLWTVVGGRPWAPARDTWGHRPTQASGLCEARTRSLGTPPPPLGPEMGSTQCRGKREDRPGELPKLPATTPPARGLGWEEGAGRALFPPEAGKAEAGQRSGPPAGGVGHTAGQEQALPTSRGRLLPSPKAWGPDRPSPTRPPATAVPIAQRGQVRPGRRVHPEAPGGRDAASPILPAPLSDGGVPLPSKASAFRSCSSWEVG